MPGTGPAPQARDHVGFRKDVEGLRAVAVLLVVFDHLLARPSGGFIGVDVFFVISGFLITGLLLSEHDRTRRISFRGFYARRARRILPASLLVLAVTWLTARAVQLAGQAQQTGTDVLWAAAFGANIHFARISTDYFQRDTVHSPVQHYWSLAVEEQFYLVWPVLLLVVLGVMRRFSRNRGHVVLAVVLAAGTAVSFAWSVHHTRVAAAAAYFGTPDRAWELGVGALVALAVPTLARMPAWLRSALSLSGLVGVVFAAKAIDETTAIPAPGAALPVLAAAAILAAGVGGVPRTAWALTNPISRYIGRISYSLYLWHWPVVILLPDVMRSRGTVFDVAALAITAGLSVASYHYVEEPMRHLGRGRRRAQSRARHRRSSPLARLGVLRPGLAAVACAAVAAVAWAAQPPVHLAAVAPSVKIPAIGAAQPDPHRAAAIRTALSQTAWPGDLHPGLNDVRMDQGPEWVPCSKVDPLHPHGCTFAPSSGGATHSAVVVGDSIAIAWLPGLRDALGPRGYTVQGLTLLECGAADITMRRELGKDPAWEKGCDQHRRDTYAAIGVRQPDLVVVSSAENSLTRLADGKTGDAARLEWQQGMTKTLTAIHHAAPKSRVVVVSPPPAGQPLAGCATVVAGPQNCVSPVSPFWAMQAAAERVAAQAASADYIDVHLLFCSPAGVCPPFIDDYLVRRDGNHLTERAAQKVSGDLAPLLLRT